MVEISNGNTSEISTSGHLKSRNMAKNQSKIRNFEPEICCRQKFLTGPKFYFLKNIARQLHFSPRIKFISQKVVNLVFIKVCEFWQKCYSILKFWGLDFLSDFRRIVIELCSEFNQNSIEFGSSTPRSNFDRILIEFWSLIQGQGGPGREASCPNLDLDIHTYTHLSCIYT